MPLFAHKLHSSSHSSYGAKNVFDFFENILENLGHDIALQPFR